MRRCVLFLALVFLAGAIRAEVIVLTGVYQGKDLYVKNPETSDGVGFCVFEVLVNGQVTSDEVNSPSFAIDLGAFGFRMGTPLEIILRCKEECPVKIINPEAIYPNATFEIVSITLSEGGALEWSTTKEQAIIPYVIEQFKWNKWIKVGEVAGTGEAGPVSYRFDHRLHSGTNTLRVSQLDYKGTRYSPEVTATASVAPVRILSNKVSKTLDFSEETDFEIYSEYGALVKTGRARSVDVSTFPKGMYYVNFDNQAGVAVTKK